MKSSFLEFREKVEGGYQNTCKSSKLAIATVATKIQNYVKITNFLITIHTTFLNPNQVSGTGSDRQSEILIFYQFLPYFTGENRILRVKSRFFKKYHISFEMRRNPLKNSLYSSRSGPITLLSIYMIVCKIALRTEF